MATITVHTCDTCKTLEGVLTVKVVHNSLPGTIEGDYCIKCLNASIKVNFGIEIPPRVEVKETVVYRDSGRRSSGGATGRPLQIEGEVVTSPILTGSDRRWASVEAPPESNLPNAWERWR